MKIKKIFFSYLSGKIKNYLFWRWEIIKNFKKNPCPRLRSQSEYQVAWDFFIHYFSLNKEQQKIKLNSLLQGLDQESSKLVKLILERQKYVLTHNVFGLKNRLSDTEKEIQKTFYKEIGKLKRSFIDYDFSKFPSESFVFLSGLRFLPQNIQKQLCNGVFIDGGAFNGDSALSFYRNYERIKVYSFEPEEKNYKSLKKNTKRCPDIIAVNKGLGDGITMEAEIFSQGPSSRLEPYNSNLQQKQKIELISLDQFVSEEKIKKIDCIKLDLEGFEQKALKGMVNSIRKWCPVLAISIYHNSDDFFSIKTNLEKMNLGYSFKIIKANPFSLTQEVVLLAYLNK